jgi:ribose transport system substrate-binding protein
MRKKPVIMALSIAAAAALALSGCSTPGDGTAAAAGGKPTSKLLGIVTITATDANNARVIAGATAAAKAAGWTVDVVDAAGSADTANSAITNFVSKGAGMIFDLVFPVTSLGTGLSNARTAGIPVASWGGGITQGVVMTTGNGAPFAQPATDALLKTINDNGSVLALTYRTGQVCRDRETLFDQIVAKAPNVKVQKEEVNIPGFLQDGSKYATAWMGSHPAGSGNLAVWGCWEDPTLGAISAIKQAGRTDIKTFGINGSATAIKAVQDGSLTATVYEDGTAEGKTMFTTTLAAIKAGSSWKQKTVNVPGILVDSSNVSQFVSDHPEALK